MPHTILVVPCFNEAARLDGEQFLAFAAAHPEVEFLFVDDGSTDGTLTVLRRLAAQRPQNLAVLPLPQNHGKSEAVRRGMLAALARDPDSLGFWDADLATPLASISTFQRVLARHDAVQAVLGVRVPLLGHHIDGRPLRRRLGRLFATAASWVLGVPFRDTQCGAKLFRATPRIAQALQTPFLTRWVFDVELLARLVGRKREARHAAPRILYELPLDEWRDVAGSKLRGRDFIRAGLALLAIWWRYFAWPGKSAAPHPGGDQGAASPQELAAATDKFREHEQSQPDGAERKAA